MKKGDLVIHKQSGKTGTIILKPWTKLFRDDSDWEAARYGYDSATAATAIRVCWHAGGHERTYKASDLRRNHKIISSGQDSTLAISSNGPS